MTLLFLILSGLILAAAVFGTVVAFVDYSDKGRYTARAALGFLVISIIVTAWVLLGAELGYISS